MAITRFYEGLQEEPYVFRGSAGELLILGAVRALSILAVLVSGFLAAIRFAPTILSKLPVEVLRLIPREAYAKVPGGPYLFIGIALFSLVVFSYVSKEIKLYRIRRTYVYGSALDFRPGCLDGFANSLINCILMLITSGLASPWVTARNVRMFYRSCIVRDRGGERLDFTGTGLEVLLYLLLTFLAIPVIIITLGFFMVVLNFMWVKWEQSNILIPDPAGAWHHSRFTGQFGDYFGHRLVSWLLTVLTLSFYRPWALVSDWRWIAEHTEFDGVARSHGHARPAGRIGPGRKADAGRPMPLDDEPQEN